MYSIPHPTYSEMINYTQCTVTSQRSSINYAYSQGGGVPWFLYTGVSFWDLKPPLNKPCQRQKFDPFVRKIGKNWPENALKRMIQCTWENFLIWYLWNMHFLGVKPYFLTKMHPVVRHFGGQKGTPLVRQNVKSGPFCKAKFSRTHPRKWHTCSIPRIGRTPPPVHTTQY